MTGSVTVPVPDGTSFLVLHVCTGNICRSPMAELLMRAELDATYGPQARRVVLDGAGTYSGHAGQPINPPAGVALRAYGIDSSVFRAQPLTRSAVEAADLVVGATREHVRHVLRLVPSAAGRAFTLLDLAAVAARHDLPRDDAVARLTALRDTAAATGAPLSHDPDVDDPYGLPAEVYAATAARIRDAVRTVVGVGPGNDL